MNKTILIITAAALTVAAVQTYRLRKARADYAALHDHAEHLQQQLTPLQARAHADHRRFIQANARAAAERQAALANMTRDERAAFFLHEAELRSRINRPAQEND